MSTLRGRAFPGPLIATFVSGLWSTHTPLASRGERTLGPDRGRRLLMPAKLFVGNLSFQATEEDLRELFAQAGTVETVRVITDQFTGRPRGFGFVELATKQEAQKAVEMLNGRLFRDRNLVVDEARPQPQRVAGGGPRGDRGPRPGGGGGGGWRR